MGGRGFGRPGASLGRLLPWATVLLASGALFLPKLGARSLWNPDEPRYAEVAREMMTSGNFLVPHLNGEIYAEKPPLFFWAIAAAATLRGGVDETAARLPSALAAIGATLAVFAIARALFSPRAGWISAVAFATSIKVLWQGRFGQIDMLLTALVALAMFAWFVAYAERKPGQYLIFFLLTGLATLAKGPAGFLPPLLSVLTFLALARDRGALARMRLGSGLLLWAAIVLAWLGPAAATSGGDYLRQIAFQQTVTRYVVPWHHFHPWYYYLLTVPVNFLPWSLFLPAAMAIGWIGLDERRMVSYRFAACWAAVTIAFFSLSPAKRDVYALQMFPALALLVGGTLDRLLEVWPQRRRWIELSFICLVAVSALAAAATSRFVARWPDLIALAPDLSDRAAALLAMLAVSNLIAAALAIGGRPRGACAVFSGGAVAFGLGASLFVVPVLEPYRGLRPVARTLAKVTRPDEPYGIHPRLEPAIVFYTGRPAVVLDSHEKVRAFASLPGRRWILSQADEAAEPGFPLTHPILIGEPRSERPYVLFGPNPALAASGHAPAGYIARGEADVRAP